MELLECLSGVPISHQHEKSRTSRHNNSGYVLCAAVPLSSKHSRRRWPSPERTNGFKVSGCVGLRSLSSPQERSAGYSDSILFGDDDGPHHHHGACRRTLIIIPSQVSMHLTHAYDVV